MATHFPRELCPVNPNARYVFVSRNPRDCIVSTFHLASKIFGEIKFEDFFDRFMEGFGPLNCFFDYHLDWEQVRGEKNIFFTSYEEMKDNYSELIIKLARFLSTSHVDYEALILGNDGEILKKIIENTEINKLRDSQPVDFRSFRKGIIGDWMSHFNDDQIKKLDALMVKKLKGTSLENYWIYNETS